MTKQFHSEILAQLSARERVGIEIQMDGKVHRSILRFVVHQGTLYIRSAHGGNALWYKNLRANANADLHIGRLHIPIRAVVVEDDETLVRVSEHYAQKYGYMLPASTRTMIHDDVLPTTLRIEPVEVEGARFIASTWHEPQRCASLPFAQHHKINEFV